MSNKQYLFLLIFILLTKAGVLIGLISQHTIGLGPDEAQYWTWSQHLDWGYYSKPPGIAWQIALTTYFLGNTELGVRLGAILIGTALPIAVYFLAKSCRLQPKTAFWSSLSIAVTPLGLMASLLSITDGGLVLFWTLGCIVIISALAQHKTPNYFLLGLLVMAGSLFKWPIYYIWVLVIATALFIPDFRKKSLIVGIAISLLGLVPSLIWNGEHDWVTFRHVAGNIKGTSPIQQQGNFWAFVGEQAILLSPILFGVLIFFYVHLIRHFKTLASPLNFCGFSSLIFLAGYAFLAIFKKMQGNWCDFAYPTAIVFLCGTAFERVERGKIWVKLGLGVSLALSFFVFSLPFIQSQSLFSSLKIPYQANPFRHNLGWHRLSETLTKEGYHPNTDFLFGDKYQMCSLLSFYGPDQKQAYFLNLHQTRLNQFSFWPSMAEEQQGKTGFFVVVENSPHKEKNFPLFKESYQKMLQDYFKNVVFLGEFPLFYSYAQPVKGALIFKCIEYNGNEPLRKPIY